MDEIVRHIEYLLVGNDCVIVPGLGAILAHCISARYDESDNGFVPPSRTFTFNPGLDHDDGMLVSSIARAKGVSYDSARRIVAVGVEAMKRRLSSTGTLALGLAGALHLGGDGGMSFVPSAASVLSPSVMWLPEFHMSLVTDLVKQRDEESRSVPSAQGGRVRTYALRFARVAAMLVLLVSLGFVLTTPIEIENAQFASFAVEELRPHKVSNDGETALLRRPGESSSALVLVIGRHADAVETVDTAAHNEYVRSRDRMMMAKAGSQSSVEADVATDEIRFDESDAYCLVVASLTSAADADEYVAKSKNHKLGILAKDGRYRVYAATGATSRQAQAAAKKLADSYPEAWVCRK